MVPCTHCGAHLRRGDPCPSCGATFRPGPSRAVLLAALVGSGLSACQSLYGIAYNKGAHVDNDGDGYFAGEEDCDDTDATIHMGAEETPDDGIDSNCDGEDNPTDSGA